MWDCRLVNVLLTIRRLLVALALAGLIIAPVARAAIAMPADEHAAMMDMASAETADGMPCCPEDKARQAPDCAKACMIMCVVSSCQLAPGLAGLLNDFALPSTRLAAVSDTWATGLARAPPPRPPDT